MSGCSGKRHRWRRQNRGFTLLELLVVLAIMAALLSLTVAFYKTDDDRELQLETAQELRLILQHKIDQTWLDGVTYGLQVTAQQITLFQLNLDDDTWQENRPIWQPTQEEILVRLLSADALLSLENNTNDSQSRDEGEDSAGQENTEQGDTGLDSTENEGNVLDDVNEETSRDAGEEEMDIVFMSSGEYSPFHLQIELENSDSAPAFTLQGDGVNALQILEN